MEYKVDDTEPWKKQTWYYCDATTHCNRVNWHTHPTAECCVCRCWLETDEGSTANVAAVSHINNNESSAISSMTGVNSTAAAAAGSEITALLVSAMNLVRDNDVIKDLIADALNASDEL